MAYSRAFLDHAMERLAPLGTVSHRAMFGGVGIYGDGVMFALIAGDELYLKSDATLGAAFEAEGCAPFSYEDKSGKRMVMGYHSLPEAALDDDEVLLEWARRSLALAQAKKRGQKG